MALDVTKTTLTNYTITFNSVDLGSVDNVKPTIEWIKKEIKVGSMGAAVLGRRLVAPVIVVEAQLREIDIAQIRRLMPWYTSGSVPMNPATINKDEYDYAALLKLHPIHMGGTTTEDLNLVKAVALFQPVERDGENEKEHILARWECYPDRAQFPALVYGYVGPTP